mgnify:CR=1 FL=1
MCRLESRASTLPVSVGTSPASPAVPNRDALMQLHQNQQAKLETIYEQGGDAETKIAEVLTRVIKETRTGYFVNKLSSILALRHPEEAEIIRNQYKVMAFELQTQLEAGVVDEEELVRLNFEKMILWL